MEYERTPPNSLEAEQATIGIALVHKVALPVIFNMVTSGDFYMEKHMEIMECISDAFLKGEHVDIVTIGDSLKKRGSLEKIGDYEYLEKLSSLAGIPESVKHYCKIVSEKSILRQTIEFSSNLWDSAHQENNISDIKGSVENFLLNLDGRTEKQADDIKAAIEREKVSLQERISQGGKLPGIPSGYRFLDYITGGFLKSCLYVFAGRPSMGKSGFLICIINYVAGTLGLPVLFFSLEMSREQIIERLVSIRTSIPLASIRNGRLSPKEKAEVDEVLDRIGEWPLILDDRPGLTLQEINAKSRQVALKYKEIGLICLDHLGEMKHKAKEDRIGISENVRGCKRLAKQLKTPFILLCQLNRGVEGRENKRPALSDLRETGAIEEVADVAGFLYRHSYYYETADKTEAELIISKNRDGETKTIKLHWQGQFARFSTPERQF